MALVKIKLVGAINFNFRGEVFEKGPIYMFEQTKADGLLARVDDDGRPYFMPVTTNVIPQKLEEVKALDGSIASTIITPAKEVKEDIRTSGRTEDDGVEIKDSSVEVGEEDEIIV